MSGERLPSARMLRRARWLVAHPAHYSFLAAAGVYVVGIALLDIGSLIAAPAAVLAGLGNWLLWRPGGFQSRRWTERIQRADAVIDPNWAPPQIPPADEA